HQVNVRTYVRGPAGPGIWLLNSWVDSLFPLGARVAGLPYRLDATLRHEVEGGAVRIGGRAVELKGVVMADVAPAPLESEADRFVLDRYVVYGQLAGAF